MGKVTASTPKKSVKKIIKATTKSGQKKSTSASASSRKKSSTPTSATASVLASVNELLATPAAKKLTRTAVSKRGSVKKSSAKSKKTSATKKAKSSSAKSNTKKVGSKKKQVKKKSAVEPLMVYTLAQDAPQEKYFILANGKPVKNVAALADLLEHLEDHVFSAHVNPEKNDFHSWVKNVYNDLELAKKMLGVDDKNNLRLTIYKHVAHKAFAHKPTRKIT